MITCVFVSVVDCVSVVKRHDGILYGTYFITQKRQKLMHYSMWIIDDDTDMNFYKFYLNKYIMGVMIYDNDQ